MKKLLYLLLIIVLCSTLYAKIDIRTEFLTLNDRGKTSLGIGINYDLYKGNVISNLSLGIRSAISTVPLYINDSTRMELLSIGVSFDHLWNEYSWTNIEFGLGLSNNDYENGVITFLVGHRFFPKYYLDDETDELTDFIRPICDIWAFTSIVMENEENKHNIMDIRIDILWPTPIVVNKDEDLRIAICASARFSNQEIVNISEMTPQNSGYLKAGIGFAPGKYDNFVFKTEFGYKITPSNITAEPYINGEVTFGDIYGLISYMTNK